MEKAIIVSVIFVLALVGIHRIVDLLYELVRIKNKDPVVLFYKVKEGEQNAEIIIRSLSSDAKRLSTCNKNAVFVITDDLDEETREICKKTAAQLCNVFVGSYLDGSLLFEKAHKKPA